MFARALTPESTPLPMSNPRLGSVAESVRPFENSALGPSARDVARHHAKLLLASLIEDLQGENRCREFSAKEMMAAYGELCAERNLMPRSWNSVASALAKLLRKRGRPLKTYRRYVDKNGKDRRCRVYVIPDELPA